MSIANQIQINDDGDNYKGFKEQPQTGESDEFIKEEEVCITTNYRGLRLSRLQELMKERGLQVSGLRRDEMVEFLQQDDYISQLYCTE